MIQPNTACTRPFDRLRDRWWESARFQAVCVAWSWFRQGDVVSSHPPAGKPSTNTVTNARKRGARYLEWMSDNVKMGIYLSTREQASL